MLQRAACAAPSGGGSGGAPHPAARSACNRIRPAGAPRASPASDTAQRLCTARPCPPHASCAARCGTHLNPACAHVCPPLSLLPGQKINQQELGKGLDQIGFQLQEVRRGVPGQARALLLARRGAARCFDCRCAFCCGACRCCCCCCAEANGDGRSTSPTAACTSHRGLNKRVRLAGLGREEVRCDCGTCAAGAASRARSGGSSLEQHSSAWSELLAAAAGAAAAGHGAASSHDGASFTPISCTRESFCRSKGRRGGGGERCQVVQPHGWRCACRRWAGGSHAKQALPSPQSKALPTVLAQQLAGPMTHLLDVGVGRRDEQAKRAAAAVGQQL